MRTIDTKSDCCREAIDRSAENVRSRHKSSNDR
jgi:hypothetical protein